MYTQVLVIVALFKKIKVVYTLLIVITSVFMLQWDILVIGLPNSGKDTFLKQVKILYHYRIKPELRRNYLYPVCSVIHSALHVVCGPQLDYINLKGLDVLLSQCQERYKNGYTSAKFEIEQKLLSQLLNLWEGLMEEKKKDTVGLDYRQAYFWRNMVRIAYHNDNYIPTAEDILHTETELQRVQEVYFTEHGLKMRLVVIGNQETNWRKYIHYFESAFAVVFMADISSFDKPPRNAEYVNRFEETLAFYQDISYTKWLETAKLFLVMNKIDNLESQFQSGKENQFFTNLKQETGTSLRTSLKNFVQEKFQKLDHRFQSSGSSCYLCGCMLDSRDVENIMQMITEWPLSSIALGNLLQHS